MEHDSRQAQGISPRLHFVVHDAAFFISHRLPLAIAAKSAGFDVAVICPKSAKVADITSRDIRHIGVAESRGANGLFAMIGLFRQYYAILAREKPDIVHLVTSKPIIIGGLAARILGRRVVAAISGLGFVFTAKGLRISILRRAVSFGYRLAVDRHLCHLIFQNPNDREVFQSAGLLRKASHSLIPGAGVDLERFQYSAPPPGPITVLLPARMLRDKGVEEFIEAARMLHDRGIDARFHLQGGIDLANPRGISADELVVKCRAAGAEWRGHTDAIEQVMAESHIVTLPSYYGEGLPKSLIDAAAAGRPVVTTDWPGCRDAIEPGITGLLVRPKDPYDLAERLAQLINSPDLRLSMGIAGRALAERKFDVRMVAAEHLEIYRKMLVR